MSVTFLRSQSGTVVTASGSGTVTKTAGVWSTHTTATITLPPDASGQAGNTTFPDLTGQETYVGISNSAISPIAGAPTDEAKGATITRVEITAQDVGTPPLGAILSHGFDRTDDTGWVVTDWNVFAPFLADSDQTGESTLWTGRYVRQGKETADYFGSPFTWDSWYDTYMRDGTWIYTNPDAVLMPGAALMGISTRTTATTFTNPTHDIRLHFTIDESIGANGDSVSFNWTFRYIPIADVFEDTDLTPPGPVDAHSLYGLTMDRHPLAGLTRMVYNSGFNSTTLKLRRYFDLEATPDDVTLPFAGQSPSLICRTDGTHLVAVSDGTNIQVRTVDDEGGVIATMPSPGAGKLCSVWESKTDAVAPIVVVYHTADSGSGDIKCYRTFDASGFTGWEAAVTVVSGVPAQRPTVRGDNSRLIVGYHDGGTPDAIQFYASDDNGATWGAL